MTLTDVPRYDDDAVETVGDRAVVVGASVAGLCAARVLADAYESVTVLERDPVDEDAPERRGVPQGSHAHVLLEAGRATLEDLCPGYCEDLLSAGGLLIDAATDMQHYEEGDFLATPPGRLSMYCASRPLFERVFRRRVAEFDGVTVRPGCRHLDYRWDDDAERVDGVLIEDDGDRTELDADLVVDATGRTSRTPSWLEDHGYAPPPVDEVRVDVTYGTTVVERPPDDRRVLFVPPSAPRTRGGSAVPIEGDRWIVTLQGVHGDDAPTDPDEFRAFADSLPIPALRRLLDDHEWVTDGVEQYPYPSNLRRRYERLDRFPDGLIVTGDAVASFNPIYGQGMSVAALDALALHHALAADGDENLPARFFDRAADVVDVAWRLAVSADFEYPQTEGPKPSGADLTNRYVSRLLRRAHTDGSLTDAFYRVIRMERSPTTLFSPGVARRVLLPTW
jgi:2-polyprenyl-6-methoxyphenol hydroxylase-like FAD-dependent oxidoreductase